MRWVLRALVAALVAVAALLAALAVLLPRLARRPDVQARLRTEAQAALGREVAWDDLSAGLLPPSLVMRGLVVRDATGLEASAQDVRLRLAVWPLLRGQVVVDSLVLEGVRAAREDRVLDGTDGRLRVRARSPTPDRIDLDVALDGARLAAAGLDGTLSGRLRAELARPPAGGASARGEGESASPPAPSFAPVSVSVEDGRLRLARGDAALALGGLAGEAHAEAPGQPLDFTLAGRLDEGGSLRAHGRAPLAADGSFDVALDLDGVALAPLAAVAGVAAGELRGAASGTVEARGSAAALDALVAHLAVADAALALGTVALHGPLDLEAHLAGPPAAPGGTFAIDATGAELDYGSTLHKPAGTRAHVSGRVTSRSEGGLSLDDIQVQLHDVDARVSARLGGGAPTAATLSAPPFDLAGWEALLPAWSGGPLAGRLAVPRLAVGLAPLRLDGRVGLGHVAFTPPGRGSVELDGALVAKGSDAVAAEKLSLSLAGQPPMSVRGGVEDLASRPRYQIELATGRPPEVDVLLARFASLPGVLSGPLQLRARIGGELGGDAPALDLARGRISLVVGGAESGGGRIRGVSLLRGVVEQLGPLGRAALAAGQELGGRDLRRLYDDQFEVIRGSFDLASGRLRTSDLRMVYRDYTVDLRGGIDLHDQGLDLSGDLTIDAGVDAALAGTSGGRQRVIPLAHVRGTLGSPRVEISADTVARLAASWASEDQRRGLERRIDKALGTEGAGRQVLDGLEGVLRRGSK